jgi:V8-like Glu-specific endopeptidase
MQDVPDDERRRTARNRHNREFFNRLRDRRPHVAAEAIKRARRKAATETVDLTEAVAGEGVASGAGAPFEEQLLETIVREERPVLFVQNDWVNKDEVTVKGIEAQELIDGLDPHRERITAIMPLVGRLDVTNFANLDYVGTGWLVGPDIVVTNRHVASLIAHQESGTFMFSRGVGGKQVIASLNAAHEFDDARPDTSRTFAVEEVLYIERESGPDIAFLRIRRRIDGTTLAFIPIAAGNPKADTPVLAVGYPARASKRIIPNQELMRELYLDRFDVKRAAPGLIMSSGDGSVHHDCTTLGGNSGSVLFDPASGAAVGLHYAGLYQETNYAIPATILRRYVERKTWLTPPSIRTKSDDQDEALSSADRRPVVSVPATAATVSAQGSGSATVSVNIPVTITVSVGTPTVANGGVAPPGSSDRRSRARSTNSSDAEAAAAAFWDRRPDGVIAVRVGFNDDGGEIGDTPLIAASVPPHILASVESVGPTQFDSFEVRYFPADPAEQIEASPLFESVEEISYDDDGRAGPEFSFDPVDEEMTVRAHVGPEYSWEELQHFLADGGAKPQLVSAMYEFHAKHIADAIEERLESGASLRLVLDNASFSKIKNKDEEFDRRERFADWDTRFQTKFQRIVVPEGVSGLISDSYHIKVTVRDDGAFWLSSGNWKAGSSQPVITQGERDDADDTDLRGNREWHVVIKNRTLADRFRSHIDKDFEESQNLGGGKVPPSKESLEILVDVPIEEGVELERRPPGRVKQPETFTGRRKVKALLTPDHQGAIYSEAVLELIRSAKKSLLFQIPYIGMTPNPRVDRGFIDALIKALTQKLKTLDDARVLLRSGGNRYSAPTHAAWFFKSKQVDIANRLRQIDDHHTKGMIVDGKRVLLGSHNWSKPGVTLNRDASLIFDDQEIAEYYADAFEIDWARANPIRPRRFVKTEAVLEAVGDAPPPGFKRVSVRDLLEDDD